MTDENKLSEEKARQIVEDVERAVSKELGRDIREGDAGAEDVIVALGNLSQTTYSRERDRLIEYEASGEEEDAAQLLGVKFTPFLLKSLRKYLCENPEARKEVRAAEEEAKKSGLNFKVPTKTGASLGGAGLLAVAVGAALPGALAAAVTPFVGGAALVIFLSGFDAFCGWSERVIEKIEDKPSEPAAPSPGNAERQKELAETANGTQKRPHAASKNKKK